MSIILLDASAISSGKVEHFSKLILISMYFFVKNYAKLSVIAVKKLSMHFSSNSQRDFII